MKNYYFINCFRCFLEKKIVLHDWIIDDIASMINSMANFNYIYEYANTHELLILLRILKLIITY